MIRGLPLVMLMLLVPSCSDRPGASEPELDASPPPPPPPDAAQPPACITVDERAQKTVMVSGTVVDFVTGAPVAGATVDITTGWDTPDPAFPSPECPLIATLTTGPDGKFGPASVLAGSILNPSIMLFMVHGSDRANTASDNRTCDASTCTLDHTIAAPSAALAATWRSALVAGGMTDAATNGLIAYLYKNSDGSPAAAVTAQMLEHFSSKRDLVVGSEVRYLAADRATVAATSQRTTTAGGVALIGFGAVASAAFIAGRRSADSWESTGCFTEPGWIFLEDRTVSP